MIKNIFSLSLMLLSFNALSADLVGSKKDYDKRVEKNLISLGVKYTVTENGLFKVVYKVDEKRTQLLLIDSITSNYQGMEIREVWSRAYSSDTDQFPSKVANRLLEASGEKKIGAWSKVGKSAFFSAQISAHADKDTLGSIMELVVSVADDMEKELTGKDDY